MAATPGAAALGVLAWATELDLRAAALGKGVSTGIPALLSGWASDERLLAADNAAELLVKLGLVVCWFMRSSIWRGEIPPTPR